MFSLISSAVLFLSIDKLSYHFSYLPQDLFRYFILGACVGFRHIKLEALRPGETGRKASFRDFTTAKIDREHRCEGQRLLTADQYVGRSLMKLQLKWEMKG